MFTESETLSARDIRSMNKTAAACIKRVFLGDNGYDYPKGVMTKRIEKFTKIDSFFKIPHSNCVSDLRSILVKTQLYQ